MSIGRAIKGRKRFFQRMRNARTKTGKGYLAQLVEIFLLRKKFTRLTASDYFDYRLYDDSKLTFAQKSEFAGNGICGQFYGTITDKSFVGMAGDKLSAYSVFKGFGLPQAEHFAVATAKKRFCGELPCLDSRTRVLEFFQKHQTYPVFVKPIRGMLGEGAHVVHSYDDVRETFCIDNNETVSALQFADDLLNHRFEGFLLQENLRPHPEVRATCGDKIASIRFALLYYPNGAKLLRAVWKIPTGGSITDNFSNGDVGNFIAALDLETGLVIRVVGGEPDNETEILVHPDTGEQLLGTKFPHWEETWELCKKAAGVFPRVRYQGWDIALTDAGPKVLELNVGAHVDLLQRAYRKGVFDAEFQAFFKEYSKPEHQAYRMFKETQLEIGS